MIDRLGARWRGLPLRLRIGGALLVLLFLLSVAFLAGARFPMGGGTPTSGTWTFGPNASGTPSSSGSPTSDASGSPGPSDSGGPSASPGTASSSPGPTASGSGIPSSTATPTPTPAPPAAPTGFAGFKAGNHRVNLSWTASAGAVSYRVYRGTTATSLTILATDILTTSYRDTPPLSGTYYYQVTAVGATGAESPRSIMIQVKF